MNSSSTEETTEQMIERIRMEMADPQLSKTVDWDSMICDSCQ